MRFMGSRSSSRNRRILRAQSLQEPIGLPAATVAGKTRAVDPVAAARIVLDPVVVPQPRAALLAPPFGGDAFGTFDTDDLVHGAAPAEAAGIAVGRGVEHHDRLGPVEQLE